MWGHGRGWAPAGKLSGFPAGTAYQLAGLTACKLASLKLKMIYKELKVWQKADGLAFEVYRLTKNFPKDEVYGLISQLRRAALSIPTNIVEGYARKGDKELARFINIAIGSMAETEYLLDFSRKFGYITEKEHESIEALRSEVGRLLWNFYKKVSG